MMVTVVARGGFSVSPIFNLFLIFFFSSLFHSQLFLVGLNWWLLGLKWWVVSVVEIGLWVTVEIRFDWVFGFQLVFWW